MAFRNAKERKTFPSEDRRLILSDSELQILKTGIKTSYGESINVRAGCRNGLIHCVETQECGG
jgi:hypothetical protein